MLDLIDNLVDWRVVVTIRDAELSVLCSVTEGILTRIHPCNPRHPWSNKHTIKSQRPTYEGLARCTHLKK
jgi:hypothetical protein